MPLRKQQMYKIETGWLKLLSNLLAMAFRTQAFFDRKAHMLLMVGHMSHGFNNLGRCALSQAVRIVLVLQRKNW